MLITIDVKNESFKNKFLEFIKTLDYVEIKEIKDIKKKSKKDKFSDFAGMWENSDITQESIREKAWRE